jgi:hypothetical protein
MESDIANAIPEQNKALVLQAFDTLFNKRDYEAAARFWSDTYIQHSDISRQAVFAHSRPMGTSFRRHSRCFPCFRCHVGLGGQRTSARSIERR